MRIPDKIGGIFNFVLSVAVSAPAKAPARNAKSMARSAGTPASIEIMATAPPVARDPSTERSAKSSILYDT